jgi:hypothetical protein
MKAFLSCQWFYTRPTGRRRQAGMIPLPGREALRGWVRCRKPTCRCGNIDMELHGPCWSLAGVRTGRLGCKGGRCCVQLVYKSINPTHIKGWHRHSCGRSRRQRETVGTQRQKWSILAGRPERPQGDEKGRRRAEGHERWHT